MASSPTGGRLVVWPKDPRATGYRVELFRNGSSVFSADTRGNRVRIPRVVSLGGAPHRLDAGAYQAYVWAAIAGAWSTKPVYQAKLVLRRR